MYLITNFILLLLILFFSFNICLTSKNMLESYIPTPVVSEYQNYDWVVPSNPNLGFAPAVRFVPPSKQECIKFVDQNFENPDEAFSKFIECLQNATSKVWIKNLPISSPGVGGEEFKF
jgi:hypothetical protein